MHWIYAHLIGDYILQNDWMALNKKKSSWHCLAHIGTYMLPFLLCGLAWWQLVLIAAQHYAVDRSQFVKWLCEIKGSRSFAQPPMAPWSLIVVDNTVHILWMALVVALPGWGVTL